MFHVHCINTSSNKDVMGAYCEAELEGEKVEWLEAAGVGDLALGSN